MRHRTLWQVAVAALLLALPAGVVGAETNAQAGRLVYEREGCRMCHAIAGQGNRRHPLDGVGSRLTEADIRRWIVAPAEMKPGVKKKGYRLSEDDLARLVEYLRGLREP